MASDVLFIKDYEFKDGAGLLARKDERWLLCVCDKRGQTKVLGISEEEVNRDAQSLGLTPVKVAEHEADAMMKKRGWSE